MSTQRHLCESQQPRHGAHRVASRRLNDVALRLDNGVAVPLGLRELPQNGEVHTPRLVCEFVHLLQPLYTPLRITALMGAHEPAAPRVRHGRRELRRPDPG